MALDIEDLGDDRDEHIQALEDRVDALEAENKKLLKQLNQADENIDYKASYEQLLKSFHDLLEEVLPF